MRYKDSQVKLARGNSTPTSTTRTVRNSEVSLLFLWLALSSNKSLDRRLPPHVHTIFNPSPQSISCVLQLKLMHKTTQGSKCMASPSALGDGRPARQDRVTHLHDRSIRKGFRPHTNIDPAPDVFMVLEQ